MSLVLVIELHISKEEVWLCIERRCGYAMLFCRYFVGRKAMFDSEYKGGTSFMLPLFPLIFLALLSLSLSLSLLASDALQFAFSHCHNASHHNKK